MVAARRIETDARQERAILLEDDLVVRSRVEEIACVEEQIRLEGLDERRDRALELEGLIAAVADDDGTKTPGSEARGRAEAKRRARGQQVYPIDEAFLAALSNMPPSAGCALGIDRLLMLFADTIDIADVLV